MRKKQKVELYLDSIFEILKLNGFIGERATYYKNSGKFMQRGKFQKGNFRVLEEKLTLRFEMKQNGEWINIYSNTPQYKKDLPKIPSIFEIN